MGAMCICNKESALSDNRDGPKRQVTLTSTQDDQSFQTKKKSNNDETKTKALSEKEKLADFNRHGDDRKVITDKELAKLNKY